MDKNVRTPNVIGTFYTADSKKLREQLTAYLSLADLKGPYTRARGFISPHAGYVYSGKVAAYNFKIIQLIKPKTVIIIGPSHYTYFTGISIDPSDYYRTPLGDVKINKEMAEKYLESPVFTTVPQAHEQEHSVEMQIPFIQLVAPEAQIIPLIVGHNSYEFMVQAAQAINDILEDDPSVVVIASSDLSHFHSYEEALVMDNLAIESITEFNIQKLAGDHGTKAVEMCGFLPSIIIMMALQSLGGYSVELLKYANSGDVTGDRSSVVGYASLVFYRSSIPDEELTLEEKQYLLKLARATIKKELGLPAEFPQSPKTPNLEKNRGGFVTLSKRGDLRGCIGYTAAFKPLETTVKEMAVSAALKDPRFPPVTPPEEAELEMEISVLSELSKVPDIQSIEVGKHGLVVKKGYNQGLLLPQVATDWNWDREQFLAQTCIKAGLPSDAWKKDAKVYWFTADVFDESLLGSPL